MPKFEIQLKKDLPEFAWMAAEDFGLTRATCFTNGELGTGNAEFSEPDDVNIFCFNSAFRNPSSELNGGSDVLCFAGPPGLRQGKGAVAKRLSSNRIPEDPKKDMDRFLLKEKETVLFP